MSYFELDINKWPFLKDAYEKGREKGLEKGLEKGREKGIKETLRLALKKRFGRIPATVTKRVAKMSDQEAQETVLAILDAKSLRDVFRAPTAKRR